jgi:hypothetical protein
MLRPGKQNAHHPVWVIRPLPIGCLPCPHGSPQFGERLPALLRCIQVGHYTVFARSQRAVDLLARASWPATNALSDYDTTVSALARHLGVDWHTARLAHRAPASPRGSGPPYDDET